MIVSRRSLLLSAPALVLPGRALAQIGPGPAMVPIFAGAQAAVSRTFGQGTNTGGSVITSSWNTGALTFPAPAANRYVVACLAIVFASDSISSVTIGGIAATQLAGVVSGNTSAYVYIAAVPTGATGSVVVNVTGGAGQFTASAYVYSLFFNHAAAAFSAQTGSTSVTLSVPDNSAAIGVAHNTASTTQSWAGLASNSAQSWGVSRSSSASNLFKAAQSLTATASGAGAMAVVSWGQ